MVFECGLPFSLMKKREAPNGGEKAGLRKEEGCRRWVVDWLIRFTCDCFILLFYPLDERPFAWLSLLSHLHGHEFLSIGWSLLVDWQSG